MQSRPISREEKEKQNLKTLYKSDLYVFAKECLGYRDLSWDTHGEMISCLESKSENKLIVMPRGSFKSSLGVVAYPIWRLINNPNLRVMIDSEVYTNSKNFIREIKGHIQSKKFTDVFGSWIGPQWTEGEITISARNKVLKEASITASGIGAVKVGQHYDLIIMDDLNSGNNSETPEMREKVVRHYQMNTAILEPHGTMVVIGTRYAVDDVIGFIMQNEIDHGLIAKYTDIK